MLSTDVLNVKYLVRHILSYLTPCDCLFYIDSTSGKTVAAKLYATPNQSTKISTTYVRIFPTSKGQQPEIRSNARWYDIGHAERNGVRFYTNDHKSHAYGYLGECELSELAFVDRGTNFMSDTLHSVYHGAFVCITLRKSMV